MDLDISYIDNGVWQGAHPEDKLPSGIRAVVNLCPDDSPRQFQYHNNVHTVLWFPTPDGAFPGIDWLDHVVNYLIWCTEQRKYAVLVHCAAGISRSAMVAIAYLMKTRKIGRDAAYAIVKARRSKIDPNKWFMEGLLRYEEFLDRDITCTCGPQSSSG